MMTPDREKVISELDTQIRWIEDIDAHKFPGWCGATMAMRYAMMLLKEQDPGPAELEGGGSSWWWVCGECHGQISKGDRYCRHCGHGIKWE